MYPTIQKAQPSGLMLVTVFFSCSTTVFPSDMLRKTANQKTKIIKNPITLSIKVAISIMWSSWLLVYYVALFHQFLALVDPSDRAIPINVNTNPVYTSGAQTALHRMMYHGTKLLPGLDGQRAANFSVDFRLFKFTVYSILSICVLGFRVLSTL